MFRTIKKTKLNKIIKDGVTEVETSIEATDGDSASAEDFTSLFDEFDKSFNDLFSVKESSSNVKTIKVYGESREKVLEQAKQHTKDGYSLVSIREDLKNNIWEVELELKINSTT